MNSSCVAGNQIRFAFSLMAALFLGASAMAATPTVTTPTSASIETAVATLGGTITNTGGLAITERGVVVSRTATNNNPLIGDAGTTQRISIDTTNTFTASVFNLYGGINYTYKAYAINSAGTSYSPAATFTTLAANPRTEGYITDVYVRPGSASYTWKFGLFDFAGVSNTITRVTWINTATQILNRGKFQFSSNNGVSWTDCIVNSQSNPSYTNTAGNLFRFLDQTPGDTTNDDDVGFIFDGTPTGSIGTSGTKIHVDNPPTAITPSNQKTLFNNLTTGFAMATLTPVDTGPATGGFWAIDSQTTANLFTLSFDPTVDNIATLKIGTGTIPTVGQTVSVTAHYYDQYNLDSSGNPITAQGIATTLTFTVIAETSNDLTLGNDYPINTFTTGSQQLPAVATLSNGNMVAVWQSAGQGGKSSATFNSIRGQILSSTGTAVGSEFLASNSSIAVDDSSPGVAALNAGRFVVVYVTSSGANYDIAFRIIEANGTVGAEILAVAGGGIGHYYPSVATLTDGTFVVVWYDDIGDVRLHRFNGSNGTSFSAEVLIGSSYYSPAVAALSDGNYVVAWTDATDSGIRTRVGGGSVVNTGITTAYYGPRVAGLTGGFVIAADYLDGTTNRTQIKAVRYNNSAVIQGSAFAVNSVTTGNNYGAYVVTLSGGGFLVGWQSDVRDFDQSGLFGRRFNAIGMAVDVADFEINQHRLGDQSALVLTPLASDAFAAVWTYTNGNGTTVDVYGRALAPAATGPTVTVAPGSLAFGTTVAGTASTPLSFTVGGTNLTANLVVTAPTGVEVSTTSGSGYGASVSLTPSSGTVATTTLYARIASTASVGAISGNIACASTGATTQNISVSGTVNAPTVITSATYNASTGVFAVTGTGIANTDTIDPTKLTITGANNATYTLTTGSATAGNNTFSVTLNSTDRLRVNALLNTNGTVSVDGTTFNLAGAANWDSTKSAPADLTGNPITASSVTAPTITSATYNVATHVLTVTGTNLVANGSGSGITVSKLTITGEGGAVTQYTLTSSNVDPTSATTFTVTLNSADQAGVQKLFTANGTISTGNITYNLAAADDWNTVITGGDISDATNAITVSNVGVPTFTSATYDGNTGKFVVTGSNFLPLAGSNNDVIANKFCFVGDGNGQYCLNDTPNVEITSATSLTITLSAGDLAVINSLATKNGTSAADNTVYNLSAAQGWDAGALNAVNDTVNNASVTVTIASAPTVTSITRVDTSPTNATSVRYTVTFSASVTGVDTSDFSLTNTGSVAGTVSSVTGSGTTYTVTVSSITGSGTLRLDLNSTGTGIKDTSNTPIATGFTAGQVYTIDNTAPTNTIASAAFSNDTGSSSTDFITKTAAQTISGATSANLASDETVQVSIDNGSTYQNATGASGQTSWSLSGVTLTGSNTLKIRVIDGVGNAGPVFSQAYVLDTTAPTNIIATVAFSNDTGSSSTDFITKTAAQTISGTTSANLASDETVQVSLDNGSTYQDATGTAGQKTWSLSGVTLTGSNTLKIRVTDTAGNTGAVVSQAYVLDTTAPSAPTGLALATASDSGSSNSDRITKITTPVITGTCEANANVTLFDTDGTTVLGTTTADGSGNWSITSSTLSDGSHTLTAKATDKAGNTGVASSGLQVNIDTTAPAKPGTPVLAAASDSGASNSDGITSVTTPTLSGTAEANATITIYDTNGTTVLGTTTANGSGNWSVATSTLSEGSHTITVKATDAAGNVSVASSGLSITIDTTAPTNTIATVAFSNDTGSSSTDFITKTAAQTISGTTSANLASDETVQVSLDNGSTYSGRDWHGGAENMEPFRRHVDGQQHAENPRDRHGRQHGCRC